MIAHILIISGSCQRTGGSFMLYQCRKKENNLFLYGKVIHWSMKHGRNATGKIMTEWKWWQSCEHDPRMTLLRYLVSAFLSIYKKFISMASKYCRSLSTAAIQGHFFKGLNCGKSCSVLEVQARRSLAFCEVTKEEKTIQARKPTAGRERTTQVWKYCCRCHNSQNIWRVLR